MTAPLRTRPARRDAPASARRGAPADRRPHLRLIDPAAAKLRRRRRRRTRLVVAAAAFVCCGSLFGLAGAHAYLVAGQARLDGLQERVAEEQARYQRLRLEVAALESPERVARDAQERLGMVPPPGITYLSPSGAVTDGLLAQEPSVAGADDNEAPATGSSGDLRAWATVKPYLGGRR